MIGENKIGGEIANESRFQELRKKLADGAMRLFWSGQYLPADMTPKKAADWTPPEYPHNEGEVYLPNFSEDEYNPQQDPAVIGSPRAMAQAEFTQAQHQHRELLDAQRGAILPPPPRQLEPKQHPIAPQQRRSNDEPAEFRSVIGNQ